MTQTLLPPPDLEVRRSGESPGGWPKIGGASRHGSRSADALRKAARRVAVAAVLLVVAFVHLRNITGWPRFSTDDEGTYYAQAWAVVTKGALAHYTYWYDHPPVGWLQLALFVKPVQWLSGGTSVVLGMRVVMVVYTIASAALLYRLARNLGMRTVAALAVPLVWALSPLVLFESRQVFLDNLALPWLLAAIVAVTSRSRRLSVHVAAGCFFAVSVLTKETVLIAAPALLIALWQHSYKPTRSFSLMGFATFAGFTGVTYLLYAVLKNELLPGSGHVSLVGAMQWQLSSRQGSGFLLDQHSLAHEVLGTWLSQDRILIAAGLVAAVLCLAIKRLWPVAVLVISYALVIVRPGGYLPVMVVVVVLPFAALAVVGVVDALWSFVGRHNAMLATGLHVVLVLALVIGVGQVWSIWQPRLQDAWTARTNTPYVEAISYLRANVSKSSVVMTDDIAWNDLVQAGWGSNGFNGAVWYYKLDRDIAAKKALPHGWRDVDYVLVTKPMGLLLGGQSLNATSDPNVISAYKHSRLVRSWGAPSERVELRQVDVNIAVSTP